MYEVIVKADTNDGDYVYAVTTATASDIERMIPIIAEIKTNQGYNWKTYDHADIPLEEQYPSFDPALLEWFNEKFVPYDEYGIHTIESIEYYILPEKIKLL